MSRARRAIALVFAIAAVAVVVHSGTASPVTAPGVAGKLVISSRGFGSGADLVNPDGSGRTTLPVPGGYHPVWSGDGRWIAYSNFPEPWVLRVARADGSGDRELVARAASAPVSDPSFAWSPTGAEIAYPCATGLCSARISDGVTRRIVDVPSPSRAAYPAWSPDGSWIAFGCPLIGALCLVRPDGGEPSVFTSGSGLAVGFPDWSPDGSRILFTNRTTVYVLDVDDGEVRQVLGMGGSGTVRARWSPDGTTLVVYQFPSIYVVPATGGQPTKIGEGGPADWGTSPAVTVSGTRFEPRWVLGRQAGTLEISGTASHASTLSVTLRSGKRTYSPLAAAVPAGQFMAPVRLPADAGPGAYDLSIGGTSGSEKLLTVTRGASLAAPATGLVARSWISVTPRGKPTVRAPRTTRRLFSQFVFSHRPASGQRLAAVWVAPSGAVRSRESVRSAGIVRSSFSSEAPVARGLWRCRLEAGRTVLAIASVRVG